MESYPSTPPGWDFQHEGYGQNHPQTPRRNGEANSDDLNLMLEDFLAFCSVLQSANQTNWQEINCRSLFTASTYHFVALHFGIGRAWVVRFRQRHPLIRVT